MGLSFTFNIFVVLVLFIQDLPTFFVGYLRDREKTNKIACLLKIYLLLSYWIETSIRVRFNNRKRIHQTTVPLSLSLSLLLPVALLFLYECLWFNVDANKSKKATVYFQQKRILPNKKKMNNNRIFYLWICADT